MIRFAYFVEEDFDQLIEWSGDEAFLLQWAGPQFKYPLTSSQLEAYMEGANDPEQSGRLVYKVIDSETDLTIGHLSIGNIDRHNRSARIGKVLVGHTARRGRGTGQAMIREALRIGFEELRLHKMTLGVFDFNEAAIRCYEKEGFVREGLIRDSKRMGDTYWNLIEMGILESEWHGSSR
ncbi:GNAT family N-acetyltransferase [Paenibacillus chitinolyticus]|uniref:GNAT family N-acetyltransferase n=1 Tax=Paenibacillus chitinolyticus TaxID=79263 RepID=UPI00366C1660